jgi:YVTN family beta-propeller protein
LVGHGSVWIACNLSSSVVRIDAKSNTLTATIPVGSRPVDVAVSEDAVWVSNRGDNTVSRLDPATNTVVATIADAGFGPGIVVHDGVVWAATTTGIAKIDPHTNTVVGQIALGSGSYDGLDFADGSLWASTVEKRRVYRVDPQALTALTNTPTR